MGHKHIRLRQTMLGRGKGSAVAMMTLVQGLLDTAFTTQEDFENSADWSAATGLPTISQDTTNYHTGSKSVKMTHAGTGTNAIQKTVNWDLSTASSQMQLWIYCPADYGNGLAVTLSADAGYTKYFYKSISVGLFAGWNCFNYKQADWTAYGGITWANSIVRIKIGNYSDTAAREYSFDSFLVGGATKPAVLIEFDDGLSGVYTYAYPYLNSKHARATALIISDAIGTAGYMTLAQIQALDAAGWTVGNHSKTHAHFNTLTQAEIETELSACDTALATLDETRRKHVAYPFGEWDADVEAAMIAQSMITGRTVNAGNVPTLPIPSVNHIKVNNITSTTTLATAEGYVDAAKSRGEVATLLFHNIVDGAPAANQWAKTNFEALVDYCIAQEVPLITRHDMYQLQTEPVTIPEQ